MMRHVLVAGLLLSAAIATAQTFPDGYDRVLLPVSSQRPSPGAFGSMWVVRVAVTNHSDRPVQIEGTGASFGLPTVRPAPIEPGTTIFPVLLEFGAPWGAFLFVEKGRLADVDISLRAQDLSRQAQTFGTAIPVVPITAARSEPIQLVDIPVTAEFRQRLRVHDLQPDRDRTFRVRIFKVHQEADQSRGVRDELLDEFIGRFERPNLAFPQPGYYERELTGLETLRGAERVRVEIAPLSSDLRFWAFVSVTNNETQHITVVAPQSR